jgi:hypothetical protein
LNEGLVWPPTKEDLERLYLVERLSAAKIAKVYDLKYDSPKVAESTILYQLKKNGIVRRDRAEHVRKVTSEMVDGWVKRYEAGESLKQIAENAVISGGRRRESLLDGPKIWRLACRQTWSSDSGQSEHNPSGYG